MQFPASRPDRLFSVIEIFDVREAQQILYTITGKVNGIQKAKLTALHPKKMKSEKIWSDLKAG